MTKLYGSASSNPGRTSYGYQDPGKSAPTDDRTGKLVQPSRPDYTQEDYGQSWSSQEWEKWELQSTIDRGNLRKHLGMHCKKVDPHREESLLGRNAHSARYGELIHDRTGKPVSVHHQEQAYSENFVMGSHAAEFCEQSQRPSAKQTEKNVERCRVR